MSGNGESSIHFEKLKPMQLAEIRSVIDKRLPGRFVTGLSPEAQQAMHQAAEEKKIQEATKKGKRGSKGNVLFKDTVQIRQEVASSDNRRASCSDIFENAQLDSVYTSHIGELLDADFGDIDGSMSPRRHQGRRRSSVSRWIQKRESLSGSSLVDGVEEVVSANRVGSDYVHEK